MIEMRECRYKKRLQFYLDGWLGEYESKDFEEHLKNCAQCQIELANLEEINSAALGMVDQAPEKEYWESFATRVRNRIVSRNAVPVIVKEKTSKLLGFRLSAVLMSLLAVASILLIIIRYENRQPVVTTIATTLQQNPVAAQNQPKNSPQATSQSAFVSPSIPLFNEPLAANPKIGIAELAGTRPSTKAVNTGNIDAGPTSLVAKDMNNDFRAQPLVGKAEIKYDDSYQSLAELLISNRSNERGYRLKASVLGERLLAGLSQSGLAEIAELYHGPLYNMHSDGTGDKWVDFSGEDMSTWGYLRVPSDTSKSREIRKYLIELELMQTR
jgi:hypothetical protein